MSEEPEKQSGKRIIRTGAVVAAAVAGTGLAGTAAYLVDQGKMGDLLSSQNHPDSSLNIGLSKLPGGQTAITRSPTGERVETPSAGERATVVEAGAVTLTHDAPVVHADSGVDLSVLRYVGGMAVSGGMAAGGLTHILTRQRKRTHTQREEGRGEAPSTPDGAALA